MANRLEITAVENITYWPEFRAQYRAGTFN